MYFKPGKMGFFQYLARFLTAFSIVFSALDIKSQATSPNIGMQQAIDYLRRYGYIESHQINGLYSTEIISNALKNFQRFTGATVTGNLDAATLTMMEKPRCGVKDQVGYSGFHRRKRFVHQGSRWHMTNLTYRIRNYPRNLHDRMLVDNEVARAFQLWSEVTRIHFLWETRADEEPHISLHFKRGEHGGPKPFDGGDGNLGYAFFPECGGHIYLDDDEQWTANEDQGKNLFRVAAHMIGHSLGLEHSDELHSVMSPFYLGCESDASLHQDDIAGIQSLYGHRDRAPLLLRPHRPRGNPDPNGPDLCDDPSIDAATTVDDGRTFVFKGDHYWEIRETTGIVNGPREIDDDWEGMPGNIDAAVTWADGKTYFFKNDLVYRFKNQERDYGYPKLIEDVFPGIPNNLDAVFLYSGNGRIYVFKDDMYWRYENCQTPLVLPFFPHAINNWNNLPTNMDAALTWKDQKTYFFKGREYYRYNERTNLVDEHKSTAKYLFHCPCE